MSDYFAQGPTGGADAFKQAHRSSDVDESRDALHHTLGDRPTQAAKGDHNHDDRYQRSGSAGQSFVNATNGPGCSGNTDCIKAGRTIEICINVTSTSATAAGGLLLTTPVGYRPVFINSATRYFWGVDSASGGSVLLYLDWQGELRTTFARAAGATTLGIVTFADYI